MKKEIVFILRLVLVLAFALGGFPMQYSGQVAWAEDTAPNANPTGNNTIFLPRIGTNSSVEATVPPLLDIVGQANEPNLFLDVISARTEPRAFGGQGVAKGDAITEYSYLINIDNTGTTTQRTPEDGCSPTDAEYPASCNWVSVAGIASSSPIYTQGNQDDFNGVLGSGIYLPEGRYLISVLADGYKLDGIHFTVPLADPDPQTGANVTVELQPQPLPTSTIHAFVFEDISPTNMGPDVPAEHGLAGFSGHIADYLGEVTTDVFGNHLCTEYETDENGQIVLEAPDYTPTPIPGTGGGCFSDENGDLVIPNLGPNRYALSVIPPDGSGWIQTTTLEGNHDWDAWVMEGATGLDTEFIAAGEPFPAIIFGFVQPTTPPAGPTGSIRGVVEAAKVYYPTTGGVGLPGTIWGGLTGMKTDHPIEYPWISLAGLNVGDTAIYIGKGNADGSFEIPNVPDGNYTISWWDEPQNFILDWINVTVRNGEAVDLGVLPLFGWWTKLDGFVFYDTNRNGVMDWTDANNNGCPDPGEGEMGISNYALTMRKRENSLMDRGATAANTDACGYYIMENGYPMTQWLVMEAYNDLYYTTGVTYQADNQPEPTTILGAGVDVSVLPIIGLSGRLDWGVHFYDAKGTNGVDPRNGGIVGTVSYDTTRNELDAAFAFVEDWQPGVPDLTVNLYQPVPCGTNAGTPCDITSGRYELAADGSYAKGRLINAAVTETWQRPGLNDDGECIPRDVNGDPLVYPTNQQVTNDSTDCLEGPLMGVQFQAGFSAVDGNYGFGDGCFAPNIFDPVDGTCTDANNANITDAFAPLPGAKDYLVEVEIPTDALGRPLYKVTREEDINIGNGDQIVPQVPPPACAGALHIVDVANNGTDGYPALDLFGNGKVIVPASTPTLNPTFEEITSPFEGTPKPLCDTKLVPLNNGRSIVPTFNVFTDVPIPGRFWGLIVDDLNFSSDPKSLLYGEKSGVPFAPIGIYDWTNRLVATVESDYNGLFDVLLPSTNRINCPTPSGVCANLYRFVGNDPGTPGKLNLNYRPEFRTIAAEFEAIPGLIVPADLAPTQVGVSVQVPGGQTEYVSCKLESTTPQLMAVSRPYANFDTGQLNFTIKGVGFGATGQVALDDTIVLPTTGWSDTQIDVTVPTDTPPGSHQLSITRNNGETTVNGLTFHILGSSLISGIRDNFNRTTLGNNWVADDAFSLITNSITVTDTGTMVWNDIDGANQSAFFTFTSVSPTGKDQGLFLKITGSGNNPDPTATSSAYIEVAYDATIPTGVKVRTKASGTDTVVQWATFPAVFEATDTFEAHALADGTVIAYKNGVAIGKVNVASGANAWPNAGSGGQVGVRFVGPSVSDPAGFDDFGGGSVIYTPNLYEVGPGQPYATIQSAIDDAQASGGDNLIVVYPGVPDFSNLRGNPRGAYYENLIINSPLKLQGVGPGGFQGDTFVPGSIIDGGAFAGDGAVADAWYQTLLGISWDGNQVIYDGAVITVYANDGDFTDVYNGAIDGFDLRGGDQQGFPQNINVIGGLPTGLPSNRITQGGAIFVNAYARFLQISNNTIQNNGGAYGTVRIGTPDLPFGGLTEPPSPGDNEPVPPEFVPGHNDNIRIVNNRVILNAGTNLAGGIGLFTGAVNYEVAHNDICGNFSAEYGGGVSVYGYSPNGSIHHNRIYFNRSYDEGGGVMIAGELPADPTILSVGSGPTDLYNNIIQANLANDDGGGVRFLMAGNFPMNVYNNMIVNNVSTHEGGGMGLNDAPDVRVFNNTIMGNQTTATAQTSNGQPAPAGVSTSENSVLLQDTLAVDAPPFSEPLLFNNVFWDNRAGTLNLGPGTVTGLGITGDSTPIDYWDVGVADGTGTLAPTNTIIQQNAGVRPYVTDASNSAADPAVITQYDISVDFNIWRANPNFIGANLVSFNLPPSLLGDYHIPNASPAVNMGAFNKNTINAPTFDIDDGTRPSDGGIEAGADELDGVVVPFPSTGLLDDFNIGADVATTALGANWLGDVATDQFRINSLNVQSLVSTDSAVWWDTAFGANQEVYMNLIAIGTSNDVTTLWQGLLLKFNGASPDDPGASAIEVRYDTNTGVTVRTKEAAANWVEQATFPVAIDASAVLGARAEQDGLVSVYLNGVLIGSVNVTQGSTPWSTTLAQGGGQIGASYNFSDGRFDNFSGGDMP